MFSVEILNPLTPKRLETFIYLNVKNIFLKNAATSTYITVKQLVNHSVPLSRANFRFQCNCETMLYYIIYDRSFNPYGKIELKQNRSIIFFVKLLLIIKDAYFKNISYLLFPIEWYSFYSTFLILPKYYGFREMFASLNILILKKCNYYTVYTNFNYSVILS